MTDKDKKFYEKFIDRFIENDSKIGDGFLKELIVYVKDKNHVPIGSLEQIEANWNRSYRENLVEWFISTHKAYKPRGIKTPRLSKKIKREQIIRNINIIASGLLTQVKYEEAHGIISPDHYKGQIQMYNRIMSKIKIMSPEFEIPIAN